MSTESIFLFILFSGFAAYIHTISGFALGMIIIGAATALDLTTVPVAAAVVSLVTLINGLFALPGSLQQIYWRGTSAAILGIIPAIILGVILLDYFTDTAYMALKLLLGITILMGAIHQMMAREPKKQVSSRTGFFMSGFLGGLFGGLFAIAGPPLIYHFYRQPLDVAAIRNGLIMMFVFASACRTFYIGYQGQLEADTLLLTAYTIPVVALATLAGRYYPPKIDVVILKRFVVVVLLIIGTNLIIEVLVKI